MLLLGSCRLRLVPVLLRSPCRLLLVLFVDVH